LLHFFYCFTTERLIKNKIVFLGGRKRLKPVTERSCWEDRALIIFNEKQPSIFLPVFGVICCPWLGIISIIYFAIGKSAKISRHKISKRYALKAKIFGTLAIIIGTAFLTIILTSAAIEINHIRRILSIIELEFLEIKKIFMAHPPDG
jgi:hypothetical protein